MRQLGRVLEAGFRTLGMSRCDLEVSRTVLQPRTALLSRSSGLGLFLGINYLMSYYRLDLLMADFKKTFNQDNQCAHSNEIQIFINVEHKRTHIDSTEILTINQSDLQWFNFDTVIWNQLIFIQLFLSIQSDLSCALSCKGLHTQL